MDTETQAVVEAATAHWAARAPSLWLVAAVAGLFILAPGPDWLWSSPLA